LSPNEIVYIHHPPDSARKICTLLQARNAPQGRANAVSRPKPSYGVRSLHLLDGQKFPTAWSGARAAERITLDFDSRGTRIRIVVGKGPDTPSFIDLLCFATNSSTL